MAKNASGYAVPASTSAGLIAVGVAQEPVTNSGADGSKLVLVHPGVFPFANSSAGDQITVADLYKVCYLVDDQTVAKTSGSGSRSIAGIVIAIDSAGVHVLISPSIGAQAAAVPSIQAGTATLVAGTVTINTAALTATSRIFVTMKDPGAGALTAFADLDVPAANRTLGTPGSFVVNAINTSAAVIATAVSTFDWLVIG
ncbi:hypothetical protein [Sorangium sp. So ce1389]|uniref:hypothetical protein n=1 Tax=Sorangium sp. So ce1389 TaxID=3133336 RepID=UPI003F623E68